MLLNKKELVNIIFNYGKNIKDSGSTNVQIAILTFKINFLKNHFLKHKKDNHSKRGLLKMVSHRRNLLKYIKKKNKSNYIYLINKLNLRH